MIQKTTKKINKKEKILLIDDNQLCLKITENILKKADYNIVTTKSGIKGLDLAVKENPDLIILDLIMPNVNGLETAQLFKEKNKVQNIPIIFLTSKNIKKFITKAFRAGGIDYIKKPVIKEELLARVEMQIELNKRNVELEKSYEIIKRKNKKLKKMLITDSLTKLYTRDYIVKKINKSRSKFKKENEIFSLIMLDIDNFKNINDNFGHHCGDYVLIEISNKLKELLNINHLIARWGGEEFLILLQNSDSNVALKVTNNILDTIRKNTFIYEDNKINITVSFGISTYNSNMSVDSIIKKADKNLYKAKNNGKNQICY